MLKSLQNAIEFNIFEYQTSLKEIDVLIIKRQLGEIQIGEACSVVNIDEEMPKTLTRVG